MNNKILKKRSEGTLTMLGRLSLSFKRVHLYVGKFSVHGASLCPLTNLVKKREGSIVS